MGRMAESLATLRSSYDAVVVGTGYGGGVAACRLARAGLRVAILERGRELRPGDFPDSATRAAPELQVQLRGKRRIGKATALLDCRISGDVVALVGCGVGGTSLINASVSLEAKPEIFDDALWPEPLRGSSIDPQLAAGYESARAMLRPQLYPETPPDTLPKLDVLRRAGAAAGTETTRVPINVTFTDRTASTGIEQPACTGCGDCVTGCNVGAKNTTDLTYIADAVAHGAHLIVEAAVDHVSRVDDTWRVHVLPAGAAGPQVTVEAPIVVLGAGALGSTEILERSRRAGLWVSESLGQSVSGNGDFLGYGYDGDDLVHGIGQGTDVDTDDPVGPCITGGFVVDARMENGDTTPVLFEEGTMPRALGRLMRLPLWIMSLKNPLEADRDGQRRFRRFRSIFQDPYHGPLSRTLVFLGMGFDSDAGTLEVPDDPRRNSVIDWPGVGSSQEQVATDVAAHALGEAIDASYLRSPVFGKLVTVHPLGGAAMAESGASGVVNHEGEVFADTGQAVHDGLFVADGAIVPTPLGANPSFTIAALAERSMARLVDRLGRSAATGDAPLAPTTTAGISFRERMTGSCRATDGDDGVIDLRLAIAHADLARWEDDFSTPAQVRGTAEVGLPGLGLMTIEAGEMIAFVPDPEVVDQADMIYDLRTTGADGRRYRIAGIKRMHDHPGFDLWRDTTQLEVTVFAVTDDDVEVELAAGTASLGVGELLRMAASARATGTAAGLVQRTRVAARFVWRFQQGLRGTYGKVMRQSSGYTDVARQPPRRALDLPPSEVHHCNRMCEWSLDDPGDDALLKLQRFQGGTKGPVMLAPGFAMAASQYLLDTIDPNLTEMLVAEGYDVWLFDYRAGIELPGARSSFTLDEVATIDWPAAVDRVRAVTGAPDVQAVGHCIGAQSLQMALLAGLEGIRSAVCSQVTVHPQMHWSMRAKAWARIPRLLEGLGVHLVEPELRPKLRHRLLDVLVRVNPLLKGERCNNPVCRWVFFFFGPTHIHDQLDPDTHKRIAELFGVASLEALDHFTQMVNHGHAVDHRGRDAYLPNIENMRVPITFLVGERNRILFPAGTDATLDWLRDNTDPSEFARLYKQIRLDDYAHLDNFIGKRANVDVFPLIIEQLDAHPRPTR